MINIKIKPLVGSCVLAASLIFPAIQSAQAAVKLTLAHGFPSEHIFHLTSTTFMDELKKEGADINVDYHPGGSLGDWASIFEQTMEGVVPMTMSFGSSEFDSRLDLTFMSYIVSDWDQALKAFGPKGQMTEVYNEILDEMDLAVLGLVPTGFGSIVMRKGNTAEPTNLPVDSKGIKIRVPAIQVGIERFKSFGFNPVPIPLSELYTALQLGTVDASGIQTASDVWLIRDVVESYVLTKDYFEHAFWVVNKSWLKKLSEEDRQKLYTAAEATMAKVWEEAQAVDAKFLEKVRDSGIKIVELSDEESAKAKQIAYDNEWPFMAKSLGPKIMGILRNIAGLN
ncbi:TRAP transporter substrate-binding protein DctP [Thiopseudomonas denitrificans]|uniref:TRAP-type C4-dicarboxylate transport system substrate-binding protein n=1 Tax=Thiopseudomonas denitrificans TaxID=1501432 RepID=A0A4R6TXY0_9GAMM|nr:TRAP transporter substrate-binding protein DctP [Thiopseudomonas denitrificans]TDQ38176.1 TRAP-type C4-dicarboxylate transport system substrate-binding protein [Thiopseudomonas denitrificans]